jgi:hypothetical protein
MSETKINYSTGSSRGINGVELLLVALILLKLTGNITISWWWVFAPLWIPLSIGCVIGIIVLGIIKFLD